MRTFCASWTWKMFLFHLSAPVPARFIGNGLCSTRQVRLVWTCIFNVLVKNNSRWVFLEVINQYPEFFPSMASATSARHKWSSYSCDMGSKKIKPWKSVGPCIQVYVSGSITVFWAKFVFVGCLHFGGIYSCYSCNGSSSSSLLFGFQTIGTVGPLSSSTNRFRGQFASRCLSQKLKPKISGFSSRSIT